jgi:hypothetical protein
MANVGPFKNWQLSLSIQELVTKGRYILYIKMSKEDLLKTFENPNGKNFVETYCEH